MQSTPLAKKYKKNSNNKTENFEEILSHIGQTDKN